MVILSFSWLEKEVIESGLCRICGACSAACRPDVIEINQGPELTGECVECGRCREVCPAINNPEDLGIKEMPRKSIYSAKTQVPEIHRASQDGGAVTSILSSLIEKNVVDAAVVVGQTDNWKPIPKIISSSKEVLQSSGTKFGSAPILSKVRKASQVGEIAVVGTPCQIEAARILTERGVGNIKILIGVFCMKNFEYEPLFNKITAEAGCRPSEIKKIGINKGKFNYRAGETESILGLDEIDHCVRPVCRDCIDFEAKYADISIGSVGSSTDRSTVIIRSDIGQEALEQSTDKLDVKELGSEEPVDRLCRIKKTK